MRCDSSETLKKAGRTLNNLQLVDGVSLVIQEVLWDALEYADKLEETIQLIRKSTSDLDTQTICEQALGYDYPNGVEPTPDPRQMALFDEA